MNTIKISDGELLDKYSILSIKIKKIKNIDKLKNIKKEYTYISEKIKKFKKRLIYNLLLDKLIKVNTNLWFVEDKLREKEGLKEFDKEFILLARSVYRLNDERFELKNKINNLNKSSFKEEKSYKSY